MAKDTTTDSAADEDTNVGTVDSPASDQTNTGDAKTLDELAADDPEGFFNPGGVPEKDAEETFTLDELAEKDPEGFFNPGHPTK